MSLVTVGKIVAIILFGCLFAFFCFMAYMAGEYPFPI